jgi:hypothetical protein
MATLRTQASLLSSYRSVGDIVLEYKKRPRSLLSRWVSHVERWLFANTTDQFHTPRQTNCD